MAYSTKIKKNRYSDEDVKEFVVEHKKKKPTIGEYAYEGERLLFRIPERLHEEKTTISYKGRYGVVRKNTKKGVYVRFFTEANDKTIGGIESKDTFIKEKDFIKYAKLDETPLETSP
jgi:hypothetical protein